MFSEESGAEFMKAVCVGGGPAGLYFALAMKLQDLRHEITVYERNAAGATYGWGVVFSNDLLEKLYDTDPGSARQVERAAFRWASQVIDLPAGQAVDASSSGYGINRQRLLDILAHRAADLGVRIEYGHEVTDPGRLPAADLVVACDGVSSRLRAGSGRISSSVQTGGNKYIWLGTDKVFSQFTFPFIDTGSGWIWAHAYGFDAGASTFIVECPTATWTRLGFGTMPPAQTLSRLAEIFQRHLDGHRLLGQASTGEDIRWLNFRTLTSQRWHDGNMVLLGDAAHTTHFSIGSGTKLAIEDAIALAGSLRQHASVERALEAYENERRAAIRGAQADARHSAQWLESASRYLGLTPHQFATLFHGRRSPLLPYLPPRLCYHLYEATGRTRLLRGLRTQVSATARTISGRRAPARARSTSATGPGADGAPVSGKSFPA